MTTEPETRMELKFTPTEFKFKVDPPTVLTIKAELPPLTIGLLAQFQAAGASTIEITLASIQLRMPSMEPGGQQGTLDGALKKVVEHVGQAISDYVDATALAMPACEKCGLPTRYDTETDKELVYWCEPCRHYQTAQKADPVPKTGSVVDGEPPIFPCPDCGHETFHEGRVTQQDGVSQVDLWHCPQCGRDDSIPSPQPPNEPPPPLAQVCGSCGAAMFRYHDVVEGTGEIIDEWHCTCGHIEPYEETGETPQQKPETTPDDKKARER